MNNLILLLPQLIIVSLLTACYVMFPYISRKTLSFGISIPEDAYDNEAVAGIRDRYRNRIVVSGIIEVMVMAAAIFLEAGLVEVFSFVCIIAQIIVFGVIYLDAHRKMKALKSQKQEWDVSARQIIAIDTNYRKMKPLFNPWWFSLYPVGIAATALASFLLYDSLPDMLAIRFNQVGEAVQWVDKSSKTLLIMPLIQVFLALMFIFCRFMIDRSRPQIDPANREKTLEQNLRSRYRWSVLLFVMGFSMIALFGFVQLSIMGIVPPTLSGWVTMVVTLIMVISVIGMGIVNGQSGSRIKSGAKPGGNPVVRDDDRYWKWGMFYCNPDDPSVFVEKRVGIGWTLNFGRPAAWIVILGILAFIIGSILTTSFLSE